MSLIDILLNLGAGQVARPDKLIIKSLVKYELSLWIYVLYTSLQFLKYMIFKQNDMLNNFVIIDGDSYN